MDANVYEVLNLECLKTAMRWQADPILEGSHLHEYRFLTDLNNRKLRDAEIIGAACRNEAPSVILEIGTSYGHGSALMAQNAPEAIVHTVNIPPEEIAQGGTYVTFAPEHAEIGRYYREQGFMNVRQILANTATWEPDIGLIDIAFIDGCHDAEFVYSDTRKLLKHCRPGSLIMWHDFAPSMVKVHCWIRDVCLGVERLYADGLVKGPILHLQDSWVGMYRVPEL